ncbi:acetolactate synthase large subunit [Cyanobium sp. PCC 7001]|uniref:thiamine pyrophosphate-binding protein n=1 Tax=Cyanobium sp. PCC 7001 TaxID=180281 RepID=UPI0001804AEC|nr:thiamine pyrophosphate-binding protein [Cyanobium sp. PCC 7001]EDY37898.1 acetolactate synthase large subunit [Cyanobium sp. PCC 7001]
MKGSDLLARYLEHRGITHVFELIGGTITYLLDSLHLHTSIHIISMHHEQGAGFAAEGFARHTGLPGIAMATSGPGATNLLTAIGSCYFDSTPALFITGQINRDERKGDLPVRQLGFQETDIVAMARPITKAAILVDDPSDLPQVLEHAFDLALRGRPGPVLLDLPMEVQVADLPEPAWCSGSASGSTTSGGEADSTPEAEAFLETALADLAHAERPLILAGGGIRVSGAIEPFRRFVAALDVPVVHSLMGVDVLPSDDPNRIGLIGLYGNRWANIALCDSDCLLVLGSRLDSRQTGNDTTLFRGRRVLHHVDCDDAELNNRVKQCSTLRMDLGAFLRCGLRSPFLPLDCGAWRDHLVSCRRQWPDSGEVGTVSGINPNSLMHHLSAACPDAAAFVADVGQHQMWAAQSLQLREHQRFLTSGGMGAMGFALPAAIGACLAAGRHPVVVIAGDGGFQINLQELQTIRRNRLPIKMVVINNQCHGMVRQIQDVAFNARYQSTIWGYDAPSFTAVASAYGLPSALVAEEAQLPQALAAMMTDPDSAFLLEVVIDPAINAYPKAIAGRPLSEMEPLEKPH